MCKSSFVSMMIFVSTMLMLCGFVSGETVVKFQDNIQLCYYHIKAGKQISGYIQNTSTKWKLSWNKKYMWTSDGKKWTI
jgi:hypothetical protein